MITFQNISKIYQVGDQEVKALDDVSFSIEKCKFTIILGPSGSGKSTMLNLLVVELLWNFLKVKYFQVLLH
jgi:putative ABC transport system ATP-binding protein